MVLNPAKREKKAQYDQKICRLLDEYSRYWSIRIHSENTGNDAIKNLIPLLAGNVGSSLPRVIEGSSLGLQHVWVSLLQLMLLFPGNTGLDPSQTSFFQVLTFDQDQQRHGGNRDGSGVVRKGEKVGSSEAALLSKLGKAILLRTLRGICVDNGTSTPSPRLTNQEYLKLVGCSCSADSDAAKEEKVEEAKKEESEESDEDLVAGLFD
ncbi:hypothetical protein F3Y22_tig00110879pilonHSYRG00092 [Hibiscus syriacus]|uniref:Uncharacterized protein n=1 Tax=Hibiscus syriacus TaxID=106335 RepID=A0A6A2ZIE4_HIBSY|nr:hypothetical protein F3Y22_tig00110879pilonHSYRG00092 [Hibiscus syriacus]